jgi:hypothetical protein
MRTAASGHGRRGARPDPGRLRVTCQLAAPGSSFDGLPGSAAAASGRLPDVPGPAASAGAPGSGSSRHRL